MMLPRVVIFDFEAEGEEKAIFWQPSVQEGEGVKGLAQLLVEFREFICAERKVRRRSLTALAAINNENLKKLVLLAYRASFHTDEGRPIRARVVMREESWQPNPDPNSALVGRGTFETVAKYFDGMMRATEDYTHHSYRFTEPLPLTDCQPIIKLAPLLLKPDGAITVTEVNGALQVTGLALLDHEDPDRGVFRMPSLWSPSSALLIEIVGPGHLRVSEGRASFALYADQFVTHAPFTSVEPVRRWLAEFSQECATTFKSRPAYNPDAKLFDTYPEAENYPHVDVHIAFSLILREAIALGHGGAFAVLPDRESAPLAITRATAPVDFGEELRDLWTSLSVLWSSTRNPNADHLGAAELKRVTAHRWLRRLASVGRLSAADGCVVFDRRLVLRGFGGSIKNNAQGAIDVCHDLASSTDVPAAVLLKSFGERHKSAYALCRLVPHALVFVISQDGDLRVFANDGNRVLFAPNLSC